MFSFKACYAFQYPRGPMSIRSCICDHVYAIPCICRDLSVDMTYLIGYHVYTMVYAMPCLRGAINSYKAFQIFQYILRSI